MQRLNFGTFLARITDEEPTELERALDRLPKISPDGPWLAGGALRRTLLRQSLDSDFDFFFASQEQFEAFCEGVKKAGGWKVKSHEHATTFRLPSKAPKSVCEDEFTPYEPEIEVQAITTQWYGSLEEVLDSFDFTICQIGFDGETMVCGDYTLWDLGRKRLAPHRITYGAATLRRLIKYTRQGFTICGGGLADILQQVADNPAIIRAETQYVD